jgi:hypothetical protein
MAGIGALRSRSRLEATAQLGSTGAVRRRCGERRLLACAVRSRVGCAARYTRLERSSIESALRKAGGHGNVGGEPRKKAGLWTPPSLSPAS